MHLQEKKYRNVAQCPLHQVTYASTQFGVTTSKGLGGDAFTRKYNIWNENTLFEMLPNTIYIMRPIHVCELQSLKQLFLTVQEEIHLQENTLFDLWPWPWGQGHTKCCPVSFTSCDLSSFKVLGRDIYKKRDGRTDAQTDRQTDDGPTLIRKNIHVFVKKKAGITS